MTNYSIDTDWLWLTTRYLHGVGPVIGRAYLFKTYGWDHGLPD